VLSLIGLLEHFTISDDMFAAVCFLNN
jgi:hypothetical protein